MRVKPENGGLAMRSICRYRTYDLEYRHDTSDRLLKYTLQYVYLLPLNYILAMRLLSEKTRLAMQISAYPSYAGSLFEGVPGLPATGGWPACTFGLTLYHGHHIRESCDGCCTHSHGRSA